MDLGIHPRTLYHLRDEGRLDQLSRDVCHVADPPPLAEPDLVTVAARIPDAVVCLISAMAFHETTTEIPHGVRIAIARSKGQPTLDYPPTRVHHFSGEALRRSLGERKARPAELIQCARICRVETLMQTYLEALV